jgi:hypothetical protein
MPPQLAKLMIDIASATATRLILKRSKGAFGSDIDYAMLVKIYEPSGEGEKRYSPARFSFSEPAGTPQ